VLFIRPDGVRNYDEPAITIANFRFPAPKTATRLRLAGSEVLRGRCCFSAAIAATRELPPARFISLGFGHYYQAPEALADFDLGASMMSASATASPVVETVDGYGFLDSAIAANLCKPLAVLIPPRLTYHDEPAEALADL